MYMREMYETLHAHPDTRRCTKHARNNFPVQKWDWRGGHQVHRKSHGITATTQTGKMSDPLAICATFRVRMWAKVQLRETCGAD